MKRDCFSDIAQRSSLPLSALWAHKEVCPTGAISPPALDGQNVGQRCSVHWVSSFPGFTGSSTVRTGLVSRPHIILIPEMYQTSQPSILHTGGPDFPHKALDKDTLLNYLGSPWHFGKCSLLRWGFPNCPGGMGLLLWSKPEPKKARMFKLESTTKK